MFSYLQGKRPTGRKFASSPNVASSQALPAVAYGEETYQGIHYDSSQYHPGRHDPEVYRPTTAPSRRPPVLPPIPRVASQIESRKASRDEAASMVGQEDAAMSNIKTKDSQNEVLGNNHTSLSTWGTGLSKLNSKSTPELVVVNAGHELEDGDPHAPYRGVLDRARQTAAVERHRRVPQPTQENLVTTRDPLSNATPQPLPEAMQIRASKTKRNILNPMSLLARRRSGQQPMMTADDRKPSQKRPPALTATQLPDSYDPRIRGKVVHDFSAPRSNRYSSTEALIVETDAIRTRNRISGSERGPGLRGSWFDRPISMIPMKSPCMDDDSRASSPEKVHTPVFREHFGEDVEPWSPEQGIETRQISHSIEDSRVTDENNRPMTLPPFARNLPAIIPLGVANKCMQQPKLNLEPVIEDRPVPPHILPSSNDTSPTASPPTSRSRATSITDPTFQSAGLPKHLNSTASRFSFDLAGVGSAAQEKILEEKHREQAALRERKSETQDIESEEDLEGYDDMNDMDDVEGIEEKIPGINADYDVDGFEALDELIPGINAEEKGQIELKLEPEEVQEPASGYDVVKANDETISKKHAIHDFRFTSPTISSLSSPVSAISPAMTSISTPRDGRGQPIGFALSTESPLIQQYRTFGDHPQVNDVSVIDEDSGIKTQFPTVPIQYSSVELTPPQEADEVDDLYFDDGVIDDINDGDGLGFDECVFDDDSNILYGLPLRDRAQSSKEPLRPLGVQQVSPDDALSVNSAESHERLERRKSNLKLDTSFASGRQGLLAPRPSVKIASYDQSIGLTQTNLAAYHNALAEAANQAALSGRFDRKASLESAESVRHIMSTITESSENGLPIAHVNIMPQFNMGSELDDTQDDDEIVAAANAEALENDDEGFYGQEFGFFAHAVGPGETQYANGGYFGARGLDGLQRSHSGRANFQEPNLTPITERSEWSNRNSMISLAKHASFPASVHSMTGPTLSNLVDSATLDDEDMSLSALLKLRRGAWGGSEASLHSSSGSHNSGSPSTFMPVMATGTLPYNNGMTASINANSTHSLVSSNGDIACESPTVTLQTQSSNLQSSQSQGERSSGSEPSPVRWNAPAKGHSRNNSGAESVSYVQDMSEEGGGRWLLEKRRTIEGGQVEILGREIVEGGRI
ncbi:hypothetical protein MMC09_006733 [Bachmanniomyces sp. S44760]|nr:hypothetical protein [Bachmanniomyces sp. S44760]